MFTGMVPINVIQWLALLITMWLWQGCEVRQSVCIVLYLNLLQLFQHVIEDNKLFKFQVAKPICRAPMAAKSSQIGTFSPNLETPVKDQQKA